jgi:translation initiation factor 2 beta subunit (eIF-2beta)/eIF-5
MAYAILRAAKISGKANVASCGNHIERSRETINADPDLTPMNTTLVGSGYMYQDIMNRLNSSGVTIRKNAVLAVEFMITASPEYFRMEKKYDEETQKYSLYGNAKGTKEFFEASRSWLEQHVGKENLINFTIHYDEQTPHAHAVITPLLKNEDGKERLSARDLMGSRAQLSGMQDSFAEAVKHLGLDRGIKGSKAKHTSIKEFYARVNSTVEYSPEVVKPRNITIEPPSVFVNKTRWKEQQEQEIQNFVQEEINRQYEVNAEYIKTSKFKTESEKLKEKEYRRVENLIEGLKTQISTLKDEVAELKKENQKTMDLYQGQKGIIQRLKQSKEASTEIFIGIAKGDYTKKDIEKFLADKGIFKMERGNDQGMGLGM